MNWKWLNMESLRICPKQTHGKISKFSRNKSFNSFIGGWWRQFGQVGAIPRFLVFQIIVVNRNQYGEADGNTVWFHLRESSRSNSCCLKWEIEPFQFDAFLLCVKDNTLCVVVTLLMVKLTPKLQRHEWDGVLLFSPFLLSISKSPTKHKQIKP